MREEVKNWLNRAERDLRVAEYNLKGDMLDAASFYSQQAAEKALKSLYIARFGELWRIHDLVKLARKLDAPDEIVKSCAEINPTYTAARYPDVGDIDDKEGVSEILSAK